MLLLLLSGVPIVVIVGIARTGYPTPCSWWSGKVVARNSVQVVGLSLVGVLFLFSSVELGDELTSLTVGRGDGRVGEPVPGLFEERVGHAAVRRKVERLHAFIKLLTGSQLPLSDDGPDGQSTNDDARNDDNDDHGRLAHAQLARALFARPSRS